MKLVLGVLMAVIGLAYLIMTLRDGVARDKAGVILARRRTQPVAFFAMVGLFLAMTLVGLLLIALGLGLSDQQI